ncbi:MAG: beta-ketoacyl synthase [Sphingobacteriales bacterium]|nr:beta-ketoacyl synthase [Sphingobacteriales bacterium]
MTEVYVVADNIISPLGLTTAANFSQLKQSASGIKQHTSSISATPFYASLFDKETDLGDGETKFEKLLIASVKDALQNTTINPADKRTGLIISSTKGNINLLETATNTSELKDRIALHTSAKIVAEHFHFTSQPIIVSNACISGLLALLTGMRLIKAGQYDNVVVVGADVISEFVLSGFQSFQAVSQEPCKPFDANRKGINLGEGGGTIILSSCKKNEGDIKLTGGSISNDANHISGPSRTGEELFQAISKAIEQAKVTAADIDYISAHGTATLYNDEMESKAITLGNLQNVPVNSLKGYYGHTLGAAGLIESIITIHSMKENIVLPSLGFEEMGVSNPLNICSNLQHTKLTNCLKTASGFGGCNAALVFSK